MSQAGRGSQHLLACCQRLSAPMGGPTPHGYSGSVEGGLENPSPEFRNLNIPLSAFRLDLAFAA